MPRGKRADVVGFSRASRKRLMQLFASIDSTALLGETMFVTLTYHREWPEDPADWKSQLQKFFRKLERKYGQHGIIWRLEYQKRGAPHWHLMIVGETRIDVAWARSAWGRIAHQASEYQGAYSVDVELLDTVEKAEVYLAKYLAKNADGTIPAKAGRMWGVRRSTMLPISLIQYDLDRVDAIELKQKLLEEIGCERVSEWLRKGSGGIWTMKDGPKSIALVGAITGGRVEPHSLDKEASLDRLQVTIADD